MTVETNGASFPSLRIMSRSSDGSSSTRHGHRSVTVMLFCMRSRGELNLFRHGLLGYFPEGKGYPGTGVGRPDTQARRLSLDPPRRRAAAPACAKASGGSTTPTTIPRARRLGGGGPLLVESLVV